MYKIIGADGSEYGPVTADQIRQWIAEGRANGQTQVLAESAAAWQPLSALPEFAAALGIAPGAPPPLSAGATRGPAPTEGELLAREYSLDIGSCVSRSWNLVTGNLWPIIGVYLLVMVAIGGINQFLGLFTGNAWFDLILRGRISSGDAAALTVTTIISLPIYSVFMGGLLAYYLKVIRGEPAAVADAFSGFGPSLGQLALLGLVQWLLVYLGLALCILPGIYLGVAWYFAIPLVIDRRMGFWEAMELSRRVVSRHWFVVLGLVVVCSLVAVCGLLACCIGLLVSAPVGTIALMYAYEDVFGRQNR